ncbi:tRNA lysidine(34) synthetase TilS [Hydrogenoanaerobacterium sp.]|uniref:tRNA lysidine(34) synthetase TilS n=1 Tax=Hydrogenoanaerobacterium sp. TaxID=2953763 RepID=UPI00289C777C|nr:tRNA lysidine(34) synthetase TilS [Hydrogenoanaerobacterium sp.]
MKDKALAAIAKYKMIAAGDTVLTAVSGGADSIALLHFLHTHAGELGFTLRAAHINHGIRGAESDRDMCFVEDFCAKRNIPLETLVIHDIFTKAKEAGHGLEEYARNARYHFFAECTAGQSAKVATAHTLSDSMETTLFHLARGTGLRGLMGIPPVRGNIIRPLITCTREDIEDYCKAQSLSYVTDSTNASDDYSRNRIRHHVIPQMKQVHNGFESAYRRMTEHIAEDEDYLAQEAKRAVRGAELSHGFDAVMLAALHPAVRYRAVALILKAGGLPCDNAKAALLLENLTASHFVLELAAGRYVRIDEGVLTLQKAFVPTPYFEFPVQPGAFTVNNTITVAFEQTNYEHYKQIEKYDPKVLKNALDYDRIFGELIFRQKLDGDKIKLYQTGMTKRLKKLFNEAGLSARQRQNTPVLADEQGVVWVNGFGCDMRAAVTANSKNILIIGIAEEKEQ